MHIPVFFAGLLLGWPYGLAIGFIAPLTRSLFFGIPEIYPDAIVMTLELATYGALSGLFYSLLKKINKYAALYISLISAMLIGRVVWGVSKLLLLSINGNSFTFSLFLAGGFINAWPGILLQLVLIPLLVPVLEKIINKRENKLTENE